MKESKIKIFLLIVVTMMVITILFSNMGQNFKDDITSYDDTVKYYQTMRHISSKSKQYQGYINSNSNYIKRIINNNKFEPLFKNQYIDGWVMNTPMIGFLSTLEVIDDRNKIIKKYTYGKDFIEDFRGNVTSGTVKSTASYQMNLESIHDVLSEVILFDGYKGYTSIDSLSSIDTKLKSLGASGVISPMYTNTPSNEAGFYDNNLIMTKPGKGIAKFLTTMTVFDELKTFATDGYIIKIKSGGEIQSINYKNVYGVIEGKNPSYKPLVIGVFYDSPYKIVNNKYIAPKNYLVPPSLVLDCLRVVYKQRLRKPDRTIIFAFLSGYSRNKIGLTRFLNTTENCNILFLDGYGLKDNISLTYGKNSSAFSSSLSYFLNKAEFKITTRKKNDKLHSNVVLATTDEFFNQKELKVPEATIIKNSSRAILTFIQDECYNLNILTGHIRYIKVFLQHIRNYSALLSIVAITILALVLFFPVNRFNRRDK